MIRWETTGGDVADTWRAHVARADRLEAVPEELESLVPIGHFARLRGTDGVELTASPPGSGHFARLRGTDGVELTALPPGTGHFARLRDTDGAELTALSPGTGHFARFRDTERPQLTGSGLPRKTASH